MGILHQLKQFAFVKLRILKYQWLTECENIIGKPIKNQPLLLNGKGKIVFGLNCKFGYKDSAGFYSSYTYIEARNPNAVVVFGNNNYFNNNCTIEAFDSIEFGNDV
jgi:maltose O-acetyltransferase